MKVPPVISTRPHPATGGEQLRCVASEQVPAEHDWPAEQVRPQVPQLARSVAVFTQEEPQSVRGKMHEGEVSAGAKSGGDVSKCTSGRGVSTCASGRDASPT